MIAASATHLVLIPSYNPGSKVYETVRTARQHWNPVWVVVDGSNDGSAEGLQQMAAQDVDFSFEGNERMNCQYDGEDLQIAFNAKFLIEMLNAADTDDVRLELSTPTKAGLIKPTEQAEGEDLLMLVMPLMLNN